MQLRPISDFGGWKACVARVHQNDFPPEANTAVTFAAGYVPVIVRQRVFVAVRLNLL